MGKAEKRRYFNRELSWLQFNRRVQVEADNPRNPLLERAKFLAIVSGNLDEFVQVRLRRIVKSAALGESKDPSGLSAMDIKGRVFRGILHQQNMQYMLYEGLLSEMYLRGVRLYPTFALDKSKLQEAESLFETEIMPLCRPVSFSSKSVFAGLPQKQLNLCLWVLSGDGVSSEMFTMPLPQSLRRLYPLSDGDDKCLIALEDIVKLFAARLFEGRTVRSAYVYRIIRNQDFPMRSDMLGVENSVRDMLKRRRTGEIMRLEVEARMPEAMQNALRERLYVKDERIYRVTGPIDLNKLLMRLYDAMDMPLLKYEAGHEPETPEIMDGTIFDKLKERDYFLYHPYISFDPVVRFISSAADDPSVRSIKITLYRVSRDSPIVQALERAARGGKRVFVLFEARARFDEENNLFWGERLTRAGCIVCYGLPSFKTHSKITLITREEQGEIRRYLHLGTGNYHDGTARIYTDMGVLTSDGVLCEDAELFFSGIESGQSVTQTRELIVAPDMMLPRILHLIRREAEHARAGRASGIVAKMNGLIDPDVIAALYDASRAGVRIRLIVRGICCLVPGIRGMSENIRVISIVGRHLEHARAFVFENGGETEVYLSSADWMPRNLRKRVELMFPVKDERIAGEVISVLTLQLSDNEKAWQLGGDGMYTRVEAGTRMPVNAQEELIKNVRGVFTGKVITGEISDFTMI